MLTGLLGQYESSYPSRREHIGTLLGQHQWPPVRDARNAKEGGSPLRRKQDLGGRRRDVREGSVSAQQCFVKQEGERGGVTRDSYKM